MNDEDSLSSASNLRKNPADTPPADAEVAVRPPEPASDAIKLPPSMAETPQIRSPLPRIQTPQPPSAAEPPPSTAEETRILPPQLRNIMAPLKDPGGVLSGGGIRYNFLDFPNRPSINDYYRILCFL